MARSLAKLQGKRLDRPYRRGAASLYLAPPSWVWYGVFINGGYVLYGHHETLPPIAAPWGARELLIEQAAVSIRQREKETLLKASKRRACALGND